MTKKRPKIGSLPRLNMPKKSQDSFFNKLERPPRRTIEKIDSDTKHAYYKSIDDITKRIFELKTLSDWVINCETNSITLKLSDPNFIIPKITVVIDDSLAYTIECYGWRLREDDEIYKRYKRNLQNVTVSNLIHVINLYDFCKGTNANEISGKLRAHVIMKTETFSTDETDELSIDPFPSVAFMRSVNCQLLVNNDVCYACKTYSQSHFQDQSIKSKRLHEPAKLKAPISKTAPQRIKLTLQQSRLKCKQLEQELNKMKKELQQLSFSIDTQLHNDFTEILSENNNKLTPFMNLFWQQQKKLFSYNPKGMRYHPMIIRFCLSLASKSKSAYEELRNSNILVLPSSRTLRDYKNAIAPQTGFRKQIIDDLNKLTRDYFDIQRCLFVN